MAEPRPEDQAEFTGWAFADPVTDDGPSHEQIDASRIADGLPPIYLRPPQVPSSRPFVTMTYIHRGCCARSGQVTFRHWPVLADGTLSTDRVVCAQSPAGLELERIG